MLMRRAELPGEQVFDEGYLMYAEDVDLCYRVRAAGWQVAYCADAPVIHYGGGSASRVSYRQLQRLYASKARFLARSRGQAAAYVFRACVRLVALAQAARWFLVGGNVEGGRSQAKAYLHLVRAPL